MSNRPANAIDSPVANQPTSCLGPAGRTIVCVVGVAVGRLGVVVDIIINVRSSGKCNV